MTFRDDFDSVDIKYSIRTYSIIIMLIVISIVVGFGVYISYETNHINTFYKIDRQLSSIVSDYEDIQISLRVGKLLKDNKTSDYYEIKEQMENINSKILDKLNDVSQKENQILEYEALVSEKEKVLMNDILLEINDINKEIKSVNLLNMDTDYFENMDENIGIVINEMVGINREVIETQKIINGNISSSIKLFLVIILLIILICYSLLNIRVINPLSYISKELRNNAFNFRTRSMEVNTKDEIGFLIHNYNYLRNRIVAVEDLSSTINQKNDFDSVLTHLFKEFKMFIPYSRIGVAVLSEDKENIIAYKARTDSKIYLREGYTNRLRDTSLLEVVEKNEPRIINDLPKYLEEKPNSDSTRLIIKEGMQSSVTLPLRINGECIGVVFFSSRRKYAYKEVHINFLRTIANNLATIFDKSFMHDDLIISTIEGFASLVESKDSDTGNHLERMKNYSVFIANLLKENNIYKDQVNDEFVSQIRKFSAIHDIGKVSIPDKILLKPGKLTYEEFEIMKKHATVGGEILQNMNKNIHGNNKNLYNVGIDIAMYHHEKWNGSGYPYGMKGQEIPLAARIVALADVFDALMSKRPYKSAFELDRTFTIIENDSGKHFDPAIVDVVLANKDRLINLYNLLSKRV